MGVGGAAGVLDKHGSHFGSWVNLRDTKVVLDVTDAMHWFVKKHFPLYSARPDLYGTNMVALCAFYRDFFKRLRERNITPVIVYAGGRLFEQTHGRLASKTQHFEQSARGALRRIQNHFFRDCNALPELAQNALKEVVNEFQFEHLHQAQYEVYPVLERLANEHQCPVITSHSDFMFAHAQHGFIWTDKLQVPPAPSGQSPGQVAAQRPVRGLLYRREQMLSYFNGLSAGADAVRSLYILLRDDFAGTHYAAVNRALNLPGSVAIGPNVRDRKKTQRLLHVLQHWPPQLSSPEQVRRALESNPSRGVSLERDFRGLDESFNSERDLFDARNQLFVRSFLPTELSVDEFAAACLRRESSVQFAMELKQVVNINRCQTVEDLRVLRSTWSLGDRVRQELIGRLQCDQLKIFDRRLAQADYRTIRPIEAASQRPRSPASRPTSPTGAAFGGGATSPAMTRARLFWLFHFDEPTLERATSFVQRLCQIGTEQARGLALLLLLTRFGYKLGFRENYDNNNQPQQRISTANLGQEQFRSGAPNSPDAASHSASLPSNASSGTDPADPNTTRGMAGTYLEARAREVHYTTIVNSYVFYANAQEVGDSTRQDVPAEIRVARARMGELERQANFQGQGDVEYFQIKHRIELLNSVLHYYKEVNSLFNFVGPNVLVNRCYNATLMYQLMRRWSNNLRDHLLRLDERLMSLLNE